MANKLEYTAHRASVVSVECREGRARDERRLGLLARFVRVILAELVHQALHGHRPQRLYRAFAWYVRLRPHRSFTSRLVVLQPQHLRDVNCQCNRNSLQGVVDDSTHLSPTL